MYFNKINESNTIFFQSFLITKCLNYFIGHWKFLIFEKL